MEFDAESDMVITSRRDMPSLRANSAWATKSSSWLKISCKADLLFKWQYFLYRFCAIGKLRMISWKSANWVVSFNCNRTVYTKSVSPEFVALNSAFLFSPNFNKSGTCRLDFGSNSRSWKKKGVIDTRHWIAADFGVISLLSLNFSAPILVLSSQYCRRRCLERLAHAAYRIFYAPHRHHL